MNHFVAFDLEITKEIPEGVYNWRTIRPLGVSCAATVTDDGEPSLWHGVLDENGDMFAPSMSPERIMQLVDYLHTMHQAGYSIVTWNGLGFDFDVLAEEARDPHTALVCVDLAMNHVDIAFHMLCDKGFMIGLEAAAEGLGVAGKTEGMHGSLAPVMWANNRHDQDSVLEYVAQDVRATANVYKAICEKGFLPWISRAGRQNYWRVKDLLTVKQALALPQPDTSWMTKPRKREDCLGWTKEWL